MATGLSLYDILGVPQNASLDAVRKAYKLKVLETHPDKLPRGMRPAEVEAAQARFRDVRNAFEVLSDPAKRRAYDNGLNYFRQHTTVNDMQAKLARERAEWARQSKMRYQQRMSALKEEMRASRQRYQDTMEKVELRYQEKVRTVEEELQAKREVEIQAEGNAGETFDLADEMLRELRRLNPEWEMRRQDILRRREERLRGEARMKV